MARGKGGGPHTIIGRKRSSCNSTKHGMYAARDAILPDEKQEDFDRLKNNWMEEWEPEGFMEVRLVEELVSNDWLLHRGRRRVSQAEKDAAGEDGLLPDQWSAEAKENVAYLSQLRNQAERAFYRSLAALNQLRRDILREKNYCRQLQKDNRNLDKENQELRSELATRPPAPEPETSAKPEAKELTPAQKLFAGQLYGGKKIAKKKVKVLNQWVSVYVEDGKTVTTLYPPNEELIERGQKMWPPPELVYRTFDFRCGVPKEYQWAVGHAKSTKQNGGVGVQRMTADEWLKCIEREKHDPHGHVGPTEVGNLPRPRERGGCDCPSCTNPENLKLLEEWEKKRAA